MLTTTTTYISDAGKLSQSANETSETETVLESQKDGIPAISFVLAGFGLGLGLVVFISAVIIVFSKWRKRKKKKMLRIFENPNPLYGNYYFEDSDDRCNIEVSSFFSFCMNVM